MKPAPHYSPDTPARLVGHSMGANIAATYAALRPQRVAQLVMMDFLGLKPTPEIDAPTQLGNGWMKSPRRRVCASTATTTSLARRLTIVNPRLTPERAPSWPATSAARPPTVGNGLRPLAQNRLTHPLPCR